MDISQFLGGNYLTHLDLPRPVQQWTIGKVDQQMVGQGPNADRKICVLFGEFPGKALALNKTNLKRIAGLYGMNASAWIGQQLVVFRSTTNFQGVSKLCIRVCGPGQAPLDPICDAQGGPVPYQPPTAPTLEQPAQQPPTSAAQLDAPVQPPQQGAATPQPPVQPQPDQAPWEVSQPQQQNPPSA
jgi:hypothetical protein